MLRLIKTAFFLMLAVVAAAGWFFRSELKTAWNRFSKPVLTLSHPLHRPDPARYQTLKEETERWRQTLGKRYRDARSDAQRDAVIAEARSFLETALPDMMRCWLGTPWDFHGTSETPGQGKIACGYFVATVLRDAGFRLDRYKLARQPSQNILRSFLPAADLQLRVGVPYETYAAELRGSSPGVRIVGLDTHVAFIITGSDGFRFVHSSGSDPWCVVDESQDQAEVLRRSNYRVQGSLTGNKQVIIRWLRAEKIAVKS